jgi:hypothetical protein
VAYFTFADGAALPAASLNTYLMKQAVIVCTAGTRPASPIEGMTIYETDTDGYLLYNGTAWLRTTPISASVATSETSTSTAYTDLATGGPAVTLTTGTVALVTISATQYNNTNGNSTSTSFGVSGATTLAASDTYSISQGTNGGFSIARTVRISGLTAGSNTFTMKYKVSATTGTWFNRDITVVGLPA